MVDLLPNTIEIKHFSQIEATRLKTLLDTLTSDLLDIADALEALDSVAPELTRVIKNKKFDSNLSAFANRLAELAAIAEFRVEDAIS